MSYRLHCSHFTAGCIDQVNGFVCSCRPGYEGELCDLDRRGCRSSPCLNAATCVSEGGNSYSCLCSDGMTSAIFVPGLFFIFFPYFCPLIIVWELEFWGWGLERGFWGKGVKLMGLEACDSRLSGFLWS